MIKSYRSPRLVKYMVEIPVDKRRELVWYVAIYAQDFSRATVEALLGPDFRTVRYLFKLPACPDPSCGKSFETGFDVP